MSTRVEADFAINICEVLTQRIDMPYHSMVIDICNGILYSSSSQSSRHMLGLRNANSLSAAVFTAAVLLYYF